MTSEGMTYDEVVTATGLDARTIRGIARGDQTPQARTLHRLAKGLGIGFEDLFSPPNGMSPAAFDGATNPVVALIKEDHPEVFDGWSAEDFGELSSRFGVGGALTKEGVVEAAHQMNATRSLLNKAKLVLETDHAQLLSGLIDVLYGHVQMRK